MSAASGYAGFPLLDVNGPCPVCGAQVVRPLHVYRNHPQRRIADADELVLTGCEACGVVWSHPLPDDEELDRFYGLSGGWEKRPSIEAARTPEAQVQTERSLETKYRTYRPQLELLLPHLDLPGGAPRRVFDFGCGLGAWLDLFAEQGWETEGLEPGPTAAMITAERHTVVDEIPKDERYGLVIMHHVLEHLRHPVETLRDLAAASADGGYLYVSVPNLGRLEEHGKLPYVASGVHIFSYTVEGARSVLAEAGWELVEHFEGPEWERQGVPPGMRLKVLARKVGAVPERNGRPLDAALESLRAYAEQQRERARAERGTLQARAGEGAREVYRAGRRRWRKARKRRAKKKRRR